MQLFKHTLGCFLILAMFQEGKTEENHSLSLKIGPLLSLSNIHSLKATDSSPQAGTGFHAHVGQRRGPLEFTLSSYAHFGDFRRVEMDVRQTRISGHGSYQSVSFGPTVGLTLFSEKFSAGGSFTPVIFFGPAIAILSFKFKDLISIQGPDFSAQNKITIDSWGGVLGLRLNHLTQNYYLEFLYKYLRGDIVTVIGGTRTSVVSLFEDHTPQFITEHTLILALGTQLF